MKTITPPIKSQGIKTKLVPWIMELRGELSGKWIEPFLGTGVVAFNSKAKSALLSDINPHIIRFYSDLQKDIITPEIVKHYLQEEGAKLAVAGDNGYDHYRLVRDRFNTSFDPLDFLFLSRAGFNGMVRFSKKGNWNIPFCKKPNRFSQAYVTKIVNQTKICKEMIQKDWSFVCQDFREIIPQAKEGDLIYCDPPYAGRYVDYYSGWSDEDEKDLFELLSQTKARFILSSWHHNDYRANENIEKYWNKFNIITKDHFYHTGAKEENRNPVVEALIFNFQTNMNTHNHGYKNIKEEQLTLFESPSPSMAQAL
jgi:DNA adenine methylase